MSLPLQQLGGTKIAPLPGLAVGATGAYPSG